MSSSFSSRVLLKRAEVRPKAKAKKRDSPRFVPTTLDSVEISVGRGIASSQSLPVTSVSIAGGAPTAGGAFQPLMLTLESILSRYSLWVSITGLPSSSKV